MRSNEQAEFTEFFLASWESCLRAVTVIAGRPELAEDQVAEAFAKAWASWRKVSRHPAPRAWVVRTALNAGASSWRRWRSRELPLADHDLPGVAEPGDGLGPGTRRRAAPHHGLYARQERRTGGGVTVRIRAGRVSGLAGGW